MNDSDKENKSLVLTVRVVPGSSKSEIVGEINGAIKVKIVSPPVRGAANLELIRLLAKTFDVSKSRIEILSGQASKTKQVRIGGINPPDLQKFLPSDKR